VDGKKGVLFYGRVHPVGLEPLQREQLLRLAHLTGRTACHTEFCAFGRTKRGEDIGNVGAPDFKKGARVPRSGMHTHQLSGERVLSFDTGTAKDIGLVLGGGWWQTWQPHGPDNTVVHIENGRQTKQESP